MKRDVLHHSQMHSDMPSAELLLADMWKAIEDWNGDICGFCGAPLFTSEHKDWFMDHNGEVGCWRNFINQQNLPCFSYRARFRPQKEAMK